MADTPLTPRTALSAIAQPAGSGGVTICERDDLGLATMQVRKGQALHLMERVRQHFLIDLPTRPACARAGAVAFVGTGPGSWLAVNERGGHAFHAALRQITAPFASVTDQSSGYAVFRVSGPAIRQTLAKGFPIDLDAAVFKPGDAATTIVSHIGVTIWRDLDGPDELPIFEIVVFRSLAGSFWQWFSTSAAEFGCRLLERP